jgi:hypothetical protein
MHNEPKTILENVSIPVVDYKNINLADVKIELAEAAKNQKRQVVNLEIEGEKTIYTDRFSGSLASLYGFSSNMYKFFDPAEIIDRIIARGFGDVVRVALQENKDGSHTALGVVKPSKSFIRSDDLMFELMEQGIDTSLITYHDGVVRSMHKPSRLGDSPFSVQGDKMVNRFVIDTPIDGFGLPSAYLSILRQVCSNGMIGYSKAFKSSIQLGNNPEIREGQIISDAIPTFKRFLESYNNEEGFAAIRQRLEAAGTSPASLDEFYSLYKTLTRGDMATLHKGAKNDEGMFNSDITTKLREMGGDVLDIYGLVSLDGLAPKQRRKVPVKCTVLDLVNFASEMSTHRANTEQGRKISAWVGGALSDVGGYDLEGTLEAGEQPQDLFLTSSKDAHANDEAKEIDGE